MSLVHICASFTLHRSLYVQDKSALLNIVLVISESSMLWTHYGNRVNYSPIPWCHSLNTVALHPNLGSFIIFHKSKLLSDFIALLKYWYCFLKKNNYNANSSKLSGCRLPTLSERFFADVPFRFADTEFVVQWSFPRSSSGRWFHSPALHDAYIGYSFSLKEKFETAVWQVTASSSIFTAKADSWYFGFSSLGSHSPFFSRIWITVGMTHYLRFSFLALTLKDMLSTVIWILTCEYLKYLSPPSNCDIYVHNQDSALVFCNLAIRILFTIFTNKKIVISIEIFWPHYFHVSKILK